jgi:hypothetical protein
MLKTGGVHHADITFIGNLNRKLQNVSEALKQLAIELDEKK